MRCHFRRKINDFKGLQAPETNGEMTTDSVQGQSIRHKAKKNSHVGPLALIIDLQSRCWAGIFKLLFFKEGRGNSCSGSRDADERAKLSREDTFKMTPPPREGDTDREKRRSNFPHSSPSLVPLTLYTTPFPVSPPQKTPNNHFHTLVCLSSPHCPPPHPTLFPQELIVHSAHGCDRIALHSHSPSSSGHYPPPKKSCRDLLISFPPRRFVGKGKKAHNPAITPTSYRILERGSVSGRAVVSSLTSRTIVSSAYGKVT